jgi:hypothetical protein
MASKGVINVIAGGLDQAEPSELSRENPEMKGIIA